MPRQNHGESIHAGTLTGPAIARAKASANVILWERAPEWMQFRWLADCWHAVWRELAAAYREQQRGAHNYRLTDFDVTHAESWALWARYRVELAEWRRVPENKVALEDWDREVASAAAGHREPNPKHLDDAVRKRLELRPRRPDRLPLPIAEPNPSDTPGDWPMDLLKHWSVWIESLLERRRTAGQTDMFEGREREPGEDDEPTEDA